MSDDDFAKLTTQHAPPKKFYEDQAREEALVEGWLFYGYWDSLIRTNPKLQDVLYFSSGFIEQSASWNLMTPGQRCLHVLNAFDGDVNNGGITQFFWNCLPLVFAIDEALAVIEYPELAATYQQCLEGLLGKQDQWAELRKQFQADPDSGWEQFRASYDLLDLDWFNKLYYEQYGPKMISAVLDYVKTNKSEFITSGGAL